MILRPAEPGDEVLLRSLRCSNGRHHQSEVERFFCHKAMKWAARMSGRHLELLTETTTSAEGVRIDLLGAVAYEPGDDPGEWFVNGVAVARRHKGRGYGLAILTTTLAALAEISPGGVAYWKVDPLNQSSVKMSELVGATPDDVAGSDLLFYSVPLAVGSESSEQMEEGLSAED